MNMHHCFTSKDSFYIMRLMMKNTPSFKKVPLARVGSLNPNVASAITMMLCPNRANFLLT